MMQKPFVFLIVVLIASVAVGAEKAPPTRLSRDILSRSLTMGGEFILRNQKPAGNFNYEFDFRNGRHEGADSVVRQAGALWGLTLIHLAKPQAKTKGGVMKGLKYFLSRSHKLKDGRAVLIYPGQPNRIGAMALVGLSLVDFLRSKPELKPSVKETYIRYLGMYVKLIQSLRRHDGLYYSGYSSDGCGVKPPSPYFDGESLLFLVKAAKYAGHGKLREAILESADEMHHRHVVLALDKDVDSAETKGFYQWGTMAYYELFTSDWDHKRTAPYGQRILGLANWMIDTHRVLLRPKNTAYAFEGIIHAWETARLLKQKSAMQSYRKVIDQGLLKLTSWQVAGPIPNRYLRKHTSMPTQSLGGVLNHQAEPLLRIDVTQHQMHAVSLALKYLFPDE